VHPDGQQRLDQLREKTEHENKTKVAVRDLVADKLARLRRQFLPRIEADQWKFEKRNNKRCSFHPIDCKERADTAIRSNQRPHDD
jgi:hypothetical protein